MTEKKRTKIERRRDLLEIARLYLGGYTQIQIAKKLPEITGANYSLSQMQISYDIRTLVEHWQKTQLKYIDKKISIELERIDLIASLAYESFMKSKETSIKKSKEIRNNEEGDNKMVKASLTEYERYGDPEFLRIMLDCSERRCKLLGLESSTSINIINNTNNQTNKYLNMPLSELDRHIKELESQLRESEVGYGESSTIIDITEEETE